MMERMDTMNKISYGHLFNKTTFQFLQSFKYLSSKLAMLRMVIEMMREYTDGHKSFIIKFGLCNL